jgi:hypothetical protein
LIKRDKKLFIKYNNEKMVNLDNVSNIFIDVKHDNSGKVIFNMNYSVKIFAGKITPDYVYWNFRNLEELEKIRESFSDKVRDWILPMERGQRYVNRKCISSIGTDESKNRVILNLNYNVSHPKDDKKLTSDFVFFNFTSREKYNNFINKLKEI